MQAGLSPAGLTVIHSNFRKPLFIVQSRLQYNNPSDKIIIQFDRRENGSKNLGVKVGITPQKHGELPGYRLSPQILCGYRPV